MRQKSKIVKSWSTKDKQKLRTILGRLYPEPSSELNFKGVYQLTVSVMLSAQTTDKKVNQVTPLLFKEFKDFKALSKASIARLEAIIREINYYKTKAKHIKETAFIVSNEYGGCIPTNPVKLVKLPGIGQKTANVILGELGIMPTFPVDTHVFRLAHRLELAKGKTPVVVEDELKAQFKPRFWRPLHHWLILHGRNVCKAQRPACNECKLAKLCPSVKV